MKTETYHCDICGKECQPIRSINHPISIGRGMFVVKFQVGRLGVAQELSDVCQPCALKYLDEIVQSINNARPIL